MNDVAMTDNQSEQIQREVQKYVQTLDQNHDLERGFAESTTLHGVYHFMNAKKPIWVRVIWTAIFVACLGVCFYEMHSQISTYVEYNAVSKISTEYVSTLEFPAVTICNFNRLVLPFEFAGEVVTQ